jgi:hypothetical protein
VSATGIPCEIVGGQVSTVRGREVARGWGRLRRPLPVVAVLGVVLVLTVGWVVWRGVQARADLAQVRTSLASAEDAARAGDLARAREDVALAKARSRQAYARTHDPVWAATAAVPWAGDNLAAVRALTEVAEGLSTDVAPVLVRTAHDLDPQRLRPQGDRVDVERLERAAPALRRASMTVEEEQARLEHAGGWLASPVSAAVDDLGQELADARRSVDAAAQAAELLPPMLGDDEPRRYFVAFQNNAEARGTGGLLGAYGILEARDGRLRLTHLGPNTELESAGALPVDLGSDFRQRYGQDPALWVNANMSPHFPYAARIWLALWERQHGERLDGAVATDPVALGYVLDATGPVRLPDGTRVTGANAARVAMRDVYARFPRVEQNAARDVYLQQIARGAFDRLLSGGGEPRALVDALGRAAGEGRLLVYSGHDREQQRLARTPVGGVLSSDQGSRVEVVVNNAGGTKLDYYLERRVEYGVAACGPGPRQSEVRVTLRNTAPGGGALPEYVRYRADRRPAEARAAEGENRLLVSVFAPVGAAVQGARLDGQEAFFTETRERSRPVFDFAVELAPGQTRTITLRLEERARGTAPRVRVQPLVQSQRTRAVAHDSGACLPDGGGPA